MLILFGTYRFDRKKVGIRKDFCNACERECVAVEWQSFDCGHIFFVPALPLGTKRRWLCSQCARDPRARFRTSKALGIVGLVVLPLFFLPIFLSPGEPKQFSEATGMYVVAGLFTLGWLYLFYSTFFKRYSDPPDDARRANIVPLSTEVCVLCNGPLNQDPHYHCPRCGIRVYAESVAHHSRLNYLRSEPPPLPSQNLPNPEAGRCPACGMLRAHAPQCTQAGR
jgi:hypothetical protein